MPYLERSSVAVAPEQKAALNRLTVLLSYRVGKLIPYGAALMEAERIVQEHLANKPDAANIDLSAQKSYRTRSTVAVAPDQKVALDRLVVLLSYLAGKPISYGAAIMETERIVREHLANSPDSATATRTTETAGKP